MPSSHLILCRPLLLLPPIPPSIRVFFNESTLRMRWPKYWNFSISPSKEYSGLISFRIDWFEFLAVQGTFKSLVQHHDFKTSILRHSAFFMVAQTVKASAYNVGDLGSIPGSGRSSGEGNGNSLSTLAWKIPWMEKPGRLQSMR